MRLFLIPSILTLGLIPSLSQGSEMSVSFSGTWASDLGVIQAGDTFSGVVTFDPADATTSSACGSIPSCVAAPFSSLTFTMPAADGLSLSGLSDPPLVLDDVLLASGFVDIEFAVESSTDNNTYLFNFDNLGANPVNLANATEYSASGEVGEIAEATYSFSGPSAVPEPGSLGLLLVLLVPLTLFVRRKSRTIIRQPYSPESV